jgi:hypothetical protein
MNDSTKKMHPHTIIALIAIVAIGFLGLTLAMFFLRM